MGNAETGAAIRDAAQRIRVEKSKNAHKKLLTLCGTVTLCVLLVCLTVLACVAIWSQQETIRSATNPRAYRGVMRRLEAL